MTHILVCPRILHIGIIKKGLQPLPRANLGAHQVIRQPLWVHVFHALSDLCRQGRTVEDDARRVSGIISIASIVVLAQLIRVGGRVQERAQLTPPIAPEAALREAQAQWQRPLVQDEVDVGCGRACEGLR